MLDDTATRSSLAIDWMSPATALISCATTEKADPLVPARAASSRAFSARMPVRRITPSMSAIFSSVTRDTS